jgi:hypothetical protein
VAKSFGSLVFTRVVKALQERYGSRRQYARMEQLGEAPTSTFQLLRGALL